MPAKSHGMSQTRIYKTWRSIHYRCNAETCKDWHLYGGRGIKVCKRWNKFENFFADMGLPPSKHHMIDRIDNECGYSPSNCRWASPEEQANNTRRNVRLTFRGETLPIQIWCRRLNLRAKVIHDRIFKLGWTIEEALTEQTNGYPTGLKHKDAKPIKFRGEIRGQNEWCNKFGISHQLFSYRLKHGWSIERALTTRPLS